MNNEPITINDETADVLATAFVVASRSMDYRDIEHAKALRVGQAFIDMLRERANGKN